MHCLIVVIRLFCDYFSSSSLSSLSLSVTSFIITRNQEQNNKQFTCVNVDGGGGDGDDDDDERIWRHTELFIARFRHCCMDSRSRIVYFVPSPSLSVSLSLSLYCIVYYTDADDAMMTLCVWTHSITRCVYMRFSRK